jgi:DNA-binding transcriptional MerR regulator
MAEVRIGEFARMSRLSAKALRLYDELGLLPPAHVDPESGHRFYEVGQLERARLVASLRQIGVPLAQITVIVDLGPSEAADAISRSWVDIETHYVGRREMAAYLVDYLRGTTSMTYEVQPAPCRLGPCCASRARCKAKRAPGRLGRSSWAFKERPAPSVEGRAGAFFAIYYGEVNDDSDGPIEWCMPIADDQVDALAPCERELTVRTERAHDEAYVHRGAAPATGAQAQLIGESLRGWVAEHKRRPNDLCVRLTYLAPPPGAVAGTGPDCDFALPID